jgi:hypothetical protein
MTESIRDIRAFREGLPAHARQALHDTQMASALVIKAVGHGWTVPELIKECSRDLAGLANPGAVITYRLANCADIDKRRAKPPDWCGQCDRTTRHTFDVNGWPSPARCPTCHPLARKAPADDLVPDR